MCRLDNNAQQKQVLFNIKAPRKVWSKIETVLGVDSYQARRPVHDVKDSHPATAGTSTLNAPAVAHQAQDAPRGKHDDDDEKY